MGKEQRCSFLFVAAAACLLAEILSSAGQYNGTPMHAMHTLFRLLLLCKVLGAL